MCIEKEHDNKFYAVLNRHTHQVKVGFTEKDNLQNLKCPTLIWTDETV